MSLPLTLFMSVSNVLFRTSLTLFDRNLFGKKEHSFIALNLLSSGVPLAIGTVILIGIGYLTSLPQIFLCPSCFILSFAMFLVGLSFSYAFQHLQVRHIIVRAKLPDLFLPFLFLIPFFSAHLEKDALSFKEWIPLIITCVAIIPILSTIKNYKAFFDRSTLFLTGSLMFQMVVASFIIDQKSTYQDVIIFSVATMLWRLIFFIVLYFFEHRKEHTVESTPLKTLYPQLFLRGCIAVLNQFSFTWCVLEGNPLVIWPILNMTPLAASVASHFILKESLARVEMFALAGFFLAAMVPFFI